MPLTIFSLKVIPMRNWFLSSCPSHFFFPGLVHSITSLFAEEWVDVRYLASNRVRPLTRGSEQPPIGQMLILDWRVPKEILDKKPRLS